MRLVTIGGDARENSSAPPHGPDKICVVNSEHLRLCASDEWADTLREEILPWVLDGTDLGDHLLEIGPGPGRPTDVLRRRAARVTAVEYDGVLAADLADRFAGTNVHVIHADATRMPLPAGRFSAATALTMLHHVRSAALQDRVLAEVARVLRPGGAFVGVDTLDGPEFRALHEADVCVPLDPGELPERLSAAGFVDVVVETDGRRVRFAGRVPVAEAGTR